MRAIVFGAMMAACGAPAGRGEASAGGEADGGAVVAELTVAPTPPAADAGAPDDREPCYSLEPAVLERWPGAAEAALESGAARWRRWYRPADQGEACPLEVVAITSESADVKEWPDVCAKACSVPGIVQIRVDTEVVIGGPDCEGDHNLLIDVLTHELGHAFGLDDSENAIDAMGPKYRCEAVVPTDAEVIEANACSDGVSPFLGAECPW